MRPVLARLGPSALLALGALAVHQLRYFFAYGAEAHDALAHQGHAYLGPVLVGASLLAALAVGRFLTKLANAAREREVPVMRARSPFLTCFAAGLALLAIYVGQETLEGLFAVGHPAGIGGILGHGGWIAAPAALAVGAVIALVLAAGRSAVQCVVAGRGRRARFRSQSPRASRPRHRAPLRIAPLASAAAGRAPPSV